MIGQILSFLLGLGGVILRAFQQAEAKEDLEKAHEAESYRKYLEGEQARLDARADPVLADKLRSEIERD